MNYLEVAVLAPGAAGEGGQHVAEDPLNKNTVIRVC